MPALTPAERRGALVVVLLLALGAARDLWRAAHPVLRRFEPRAAGAPAAPVPPAAGGVARPEATAGDAPRNGSAGARLDLNRAGVEELDALPGIGPVLARRIVEHRQLHGPFRRPEDLLAVRGIGARLFERLRPRVTTGAGPERP